MDGHFNFFNKSFADGDKLPSSLQSFPTFSSLAKSTEHGKGGGLDWTNFQGQNGGMNYVSDLQRLCLPSSSSSVARRRTRKGPGIVEKFSALSLDDSSDEEQCDQTYRHHRGFMTSINTVSVPQIHHNIFQTKVTTNQISARSLARALNVNDAHSPDVIHTKMLDGTSKSKKSSRVLTFFAILLWTLGIASLIYLLQAQHEPGSTCLAGNGAGMLMVTVAANVTEWDGIWRASFTVRSDNNLILYILLIGAIVGFLRQIFDK